MQAATVVKNDLRAAVDQTLRYFSLFRYPLSETELHRYCGKACSLEQLSVCLKLMQDAGNIFYEDGFYSASSELSSWLQRRLRGNAIAVDDLPRAEKVARFIYQFPFVEFVGISGSLSKGYSDERADFDFFIVTSANRLWISRTLLHLFKKFTFLFGQQHKFCMNYFVDREALELEERNVYTATELSTLIPVAGTAVFDELMLKNEWVQKHLPNQKRKEMENEAGQKNLAATCIEWLLNHLFPTKLNPSLMKLTDSKWRRKWAVKGYPAEDYDLAFKTTMHISKNHPANYQKKILKALAENRD